MSPVSFQVLHLYSKRRQIWSASDYRTTRYAVKVSFTHNFNTFLLPPYICLALDPRLNNLRAIPSFHGHKITTMSSFKTSLGIFLLIFVLFLNAFKNPI